MAAKRSHQHLCEGDRHVLQAVLGKHVICDARYALVAADGQNGRAAWPVPHHGPADHAAAAHLVPTGWRNVSHPSGLWKVRLHNHSQGGRSKSRPSSSGTTPPTVIRSAAGSPTSTMGATSASTSRGASLRTIRPDRPCIVKRAGMISGIATGEKTIVVGGYLRKELSLRLFGGRTNRPGGREDAKPGLRKPDAAMVSDDSKVHLGVLAAGSRSGSVVAMRGTSVAAPRWRELSPKS